MIDHMSRSTLMSTILSEQTAVLETWCATVGLDASRLDPALTDTGLNDLTLYLESPYSLAIRAVSDFLVQGESGIFVIYGSHGLGKTSFRNYVMAALRGSPDHTGRYFFARVDDPGLVSHVQVLRDIAQTLGIEKPPRLFRDVRALVLPVIRQARERGITTVVWVDEGQKITADMVAMLRSLADVQTDAGLRACKLVISGTPVLHERLEQFEQARPEEIMAFQERVALNRVSLTPWSAEDIRSWWEQLARALGGTASPFVRGDAESTMLALTDGVPRAVAQGTRYAILHAASRGNPTISGGDITAAFKEVMNR
jgi:type II secretory pathway predicted ATPase ExeA